MKRKNKKGALMWQVIIPLIILLLTGAILFFFLGGLPWKQTVDREACYQSVVQRSYSIAGIQPGQVLPLRCKTEEIIISSTDEEQIKRDIANAMYDCWWMLGQGKLDFFQEDYLQSISIPEIAGGGVESSCIICSIIKFDESTKEAVKEVDLLDYIKSTKVPTKDYTYFDFFTDQAEVDLATGLEAPTIKTDQDYSIIFMGIRGRDFWEVLSNDVKLIGIGAGVGYLAVGPRIFSKAFGVLKAHPFASAIVATAILATQGLTTAANNAIIAGRCSGEWKGCYNLMLIPLSASEISQICDNIESIP
jgi:hypothetical protein